MLRCQSPFWCIPPALASSWPRTPAPTTETFQGFSGSVFTLQQIALFSLSVSAWWTEVTFSHPNILLGELQRPQTSQWRSSGWTTGNKILKLFKIYRTNWVSVCEQRPRSLRSLHPPTQRWWSSCESHDLTASAAPMSWSCWFTL